MSLQGTSRSIEDLLYSLVTSLERFKGVNGLQRLVTTGKLSLLSLFGEFERTRDEVYEKRSAAVNNTRRCLIQIAYEFDGITGTVRKLMHEMDHLLNTLQNFHRTCDLELDDRSTAEDSDARQLLQDFEQIQEKNNKLRKSLNDFCACTGTCADLTRSAVNQLEEVQTHTSCDVSAALTDFDRQRRRVQVRENEMTNAMNRASSRQDPAVQFAEFNYLKESEALEGHGKRYIDSLAAAMTATTFALEQSSMTGWASSNVFFVQLGLLFQEVAEGSKAIAANLLSIKNSQKVSRQLTDEKREFLQRQRAAMRHQVPHVREDLLDEKVDSAPPTMVTAPRATATFSNSPQRQAEVHADAQTPFDPSPILHQSAPAQYHAAPAQPQVAPIGHPPPPTASLSSPAASKSVDLDDLFQ